MKFKTTFWFIVIAGILGWGFHVAQKRVPTTEERADKRKRIVEIKAADVTEVGIQGVDRDFLFERKGLKWFFKKPLQVRANAPEVDGILASVEYLERVSTITPHDLAEKKLTLADYGLDKPRTVLDLKTKGGNFLLKIGNETRQGNDLFLQIGGDEKIYRVDRDLGNRLSKKLDDLRERGLFEFASSQVQRIELKNGAKLIEFSRTNDQWRITQPLSARADVDKVEQFLSQTCGMRAEDFLSEDPAAASEHGLEDPQQQVTVKLDKDAEQILLLGSKLKNDEGKIAVKVKGQPSIVAISTNYSTDVARPLNDFRDQKIGSFYPEDIDEIEIRNRQVMILLQRAGKDWKIVQPEKLDADNELLAGILAKVSSLQIKDFTADVVTDLEKYGLKAPLSTITLRGKAISSAGGQTNEASHVLLSLAIGKDDAARKLTFVRVGDEPAVYGLETADLAELPKNATDVRSRILFTLSKASLKTCTQKKGKSMVTMEHTPDGKWKIGEGGQGVLNETDWQKFVNALEHLGVEKIVGTALNPTIKQFGLEPPLVTLTATTEVDGKPMTQEILVSKETPQKKYYILWKNQLLVCEVNREVYQILSAEWLMKPPK